MAAWDERAACRKMGPALFFADDPTAIAEARSVCNRCDVAIECLEDALSWPAATDYGIRGGLTAEERADLRIEVTGTVLDPTRPAGAPNAVTERPPHGTPQGYTWERRHGLRPCSACCDAEAAYRLRRVAALTLTADDPRHGTVRGYRLGCRDDRCPASPSCADAEKARYDKWYAERRRPRNTMARSPGGTLSPTPRPVTGESGAGAECA